MIQTLVYPLCFVTSAACAALLLRSYHRSGARLLLWCAMSFVLLAINNAFVIADMVLFPAADLILWRYCAALAAACVLVWGFIWEAE